MDDNNKIFRLRKREGRCIEVSFIDNKYKWTSLKTNDFSEAEKLAWKMCVQKGTASKIKRKITLEEFSEGFFDDDSLYIKNKIRFGKESGKESIINHKRNLEKYILPVFGKIYLSDIDSIDIEDFYIDVRSIKNKRQLASGTKMSILNTFDIVMREAVKRKYIETNPIDNVERIKILNAERDRITKDDMKLLIVNDAPKMIILYGGVEFALYFSVIKDTGFRPSEILGLKWKNIFLDSKTIYTSSSISTQSGRYKESIKTTKSGKQYKTGVMSDLTIELINQMPRYNNHEDNDFVFISYRKVRNENRYDWQLIKYRSFITSLNNALKKVGIDKHYTQYSFRHSFQSKIENVIPENLLIELMGHTSHNNTYSHHDPKETAERISKMRDFILNSNEY